MAKKEVTRAAAKAVKESSAESVREPSSRKNNSSNKALALAGIAVLAGLVRILFAQPKLEVKPIDRIPLEEMSPDRFRRDFANARPVVLSGAWSEDGWHPAEFVATCPNATVRTFRHDSTSQTWAQHVQVGLGPVSEYFDSYFKPEPAQRPTPLLYGFEMSLTEECPLQLDRVTIPAFLGEDAFHLCTNKSGLGWPSVLLGPEGSETGLHIDTHNLPFWIAVVGSSGRRALKRVRIFPAHDKALLQYGRSTKAANYIFDFDPWRPDGSKHRGVFESFAYEAELRSGDLLYIPGGSPHAVVNLADNLGVSMNFLDLKSMPDFVRRCNAQSPLCGLLQGKGEWMLDALQERQKNDKPLGYFGFAGLRDRAEFCEVQRAKAAKDKKEFSTGLTDYCS
mmetsp:Transcript_92010/g.295930  ORF Transcript_92010/g.295930 Transcript_92010/m.295930 type:complete len:394 (-) Transcript_92010:418-1599(-)